MSAFLDMLKRGNRKEKVDTDKFTQMLIDEEYLEDEKLLTCFFCEGTSFDIMRGGSDVYQYIAHRMLPSTNSLEKHFTEVHHLGLLCNWLQFHGIPIFKDAEKFPDLALIFCKDCGRILGIKLDKWYYPYCGYFDTVNPFNY